MTSSNERHVNQARESFGTELRRLRRAAGLTQDALARVAGYSRVYITLVENGHNSPGDEFVRLVGETLEARSELETLHDAVTQATVAERVELKAQRPIDLMVHDLEIVSRDEGVDRIVLQGFGENGVPLVVTISRRAALKKLGQAAVLASVPSTALAESVRSSPADAGVKPIEHLRLMYRSLVDSDNLFGSAHALPGTHDQLRIVDRLCKDTRGEDRRQLLLLRAQFAESMAWLTQDQAENESAWRWTDRALEWSHLAGDPFLTAIVLVRKSQLAGDSGDGSTALDYATAVEAVAMPGTRLPAVAALCAAHGHALIGDRAESERAYATARDRIANADLDPDKTWGSWLDYAYVDAQEARGMSALGRHDDSILAFNRAIGALPERYPRDRGVHLARAARACSAANEFDEAARLGAEAIEVSKTIKSGRIDSDLISLLQEFESVETESVTEFRELASASALT